MKQLGLSMTGFFDKGKKTRREQFLADMDSVIPWARLCALIEPHYPKASKAGGRPPIALERMVRIYCLQQWYNLSDPAAEEELYDSIVMRRFVGVTTDADIIPDETTILRFRRLLETHQLTAAFFTEINSLLSEHGLFVGKGTIVDATIIHAPSSTKNAEKKRDPEMHQTRKGKQWYFGMKMHTGVDAGSGLVHTIQATAANVHDATVLPELLHGNEEALYGDSAYHSKALEEQATIVGLSFFVCKRGSRGHPLTERERMRNRRYSKVRAIGEHPYLVVKRLWGHAKVRYRGLEKNLAQMYTLFALANVYRVRTRLLAT
jgi:transposase, IS5 family